MTARKITVAVLMIGSMMLASLPAFSQTQINLTGSTSGATFTGTGSPTSVSLDLGTCSLGTCNVSGNAYGTGLYLSMGPYSITTPANLDLELLNPQQGLWSTLPITGNLSYGQNGSLLKGDLNLLTFAQVPQRISGATNIWYLQGGSITVTGGSLAGIDGRLGMTMRFVFPETINSLTGSAATGSSFIANTHSGTLLPTPEPRSTLLLGSGMLLIGFVLRRYGRNRPITGI